MRPQKRSRGRNGGGNPYHNNNNPNRGPRPPQRSQTFDSNGPSVKIRGNAYQVFERYLALAREAQSGGDRIAAENFFQHAEHYFRVMNANGEGFPNQQRPQQMPGHGEMGVAEGDGNEHEQAHVQQINAPQPQLGEGAFKRELDEPGNAGNHDDDDDNDDDRLPSFLTGRPD